MSTLFFDSVDCSEGKKILEVDNLEHVGVTDIGYFKVNGLLKS